jgi:two-component system, OmpR family, sensor histidine kinase KdpD
MRRSLDPLFLRRQRPPAALGLLVVALSVAGVTGLIYPLKQVAPIVSLGVVYLLAVLIVSTYWGLGLGVITSVISAAAFNFFHLPPVGRFTIADSRNWVALGAFLAVAVAVSTMAELARARAREADDRRREAALVAELSRLLLGEPELEEALVLTARRLAEAIGAPWAAIELTVVAHDERRIAIALSDRDTRLGTLLLPAELDEEALQRLGERVVPSLESLLAAAVTRERLQSEVVETASLRRSDAVKTAVLRSVSHDLRTPVTAILTAASVLRSPSLADEERAEVGEVILEASGRLGRLIDKLLDLARLQSGSATPQPSWCSLEEVLNEAREQLPPDAGSFRFALDPDLPLIRADPGQLERAFANLLENAGRYSGEKPVSVRARVVGRRLRIRVVDQGPGISRAEQDRIFSPFYRVAQSGAQDRGSGLGLAIVRGLIEANGGRVSVESLPGQGASFVIELPLEPEPEPQPAAQAAPDGPPSSVSPA